MLVQDDNISKAIPLFKKLLNSHVQIFGENHETTAKTLEHLASLLYKHEGKFLEASIVSKIT